MAEFSIKKFHHEYCFLYINHHHLRFRFLFNVSLCKYSKLNRFNPFLAFKQTLLTYIQNLLCELISILSKDFKISTPRLFKLIIFYTLPTSVICLITQENIIKVFNKRKVFDDKINGGIVFFFSFIFFFFFFNELKVESR